MEYKFAVPVCSHLTYYVLILSAYLTLTCSPPSTCQPLGFFDPLGACANGDKENFDRLRWIELKHGRVAMLAVVGYLVTYAGVRFPGAEDIPSGFAALDNLPDMVSGINRDMTADCLFYTSFQHLFSVYCKLVGMGTDDCYLDHDGGCESRSVQGTMGY